MKIAVTGANGSVGQNLLAHVAGGGEAAGGTAALSEAARNPISVIAVVRSERAAASLPRSPRVDPRVVSYDDVSGLAGTLEGVSCLVHLAGILIESRTSTYARANVGATASVVEASQKAGVEHLILISVIGADPASANAYFNSKGEAEQAVAQSGISSTIIRTPILLGPGTAGAAAIVGAAMRARARLLGGGHNEMRPLDVDDLIRAILRICESRPEGVSIHELAGPEAIPYRTLVTRVAAMLGNPVSIATMPLLIAKSVAAITSRLKGGGISPTVIDVITADEVVRKNADKELGISLTPLAETLEKIVQKQKQGTRKNST